MKTKQPSFWCIENIGDASPTLHGGKFILIDRTGTYNPVMLILEPEEYGVSYDDPETFKRYIIELEPMIRASKTSLSDNKFHPHCEAWFGDEASLESIASSIGSTAADLMNQFLASCPLERAFAYDAVIGYWGAANFDHYPHAMNFEDADKLCDTMFKQIQESKSWHEGFGV